MMKQLILITGLILSSVVICTAQTLQANQSYQKYSIEEPSNTWILDLVDSVRYQTKLCDQCMSPPTFKRYEDINGRVLYRLRYSCDDFSSFIQIYDHKGTPEAKCQIDSVMNECNDFEAYTDFTFSDKILDIWSCKKGFNCIAKDSLGLFREYDMIVAGSECVDKLREITVTSPFNEYKWEGADGKISQKNNITARESGIYTLSVMDNDGCMDSKSRQIHVYKEKDIVINGDKILCPDEITYLRTSGFHSYIWSTGDTTDHIVVETPGEVSLTVTDILGCQDSIRTDVQSIEGRRVRIVAGEELFYRDQVIPIKIELDGFEFSQIKEFLWGSEGELTCDDCPSPFGKFDGDSEIFVMITDENDCVYEHAITVHPEFAYKEVYAANIFTPDGDGENDVFTIRSRGGAAIVHSFQVFNRWGVPVHSVGRHEINDESMGWVGDMNGSQLPGGVYVYMAEVEFIDGSRKHLTGDILLVR